MTTALVKQVLVDNNRRALIKFVGPVDSATANVILLDAASLAFALNANSQILGTGTDRKSKYNVTIKRIWGQGQIKSKGYVALRWGGANSEIAYVGDGYFDYNFDSEGMTAAIPFADSANCSGNLVFSTVSTSSPDALTLFIELKKNGNDYDQGQTRDPSAFNIPGIV